MRTILHCDCNSFYASVECMLNPALKSVPMAVGGDIENRHGIILAKNELAKNFNVKTAEAIWQAKAKCPDLIVVPPHHDIYLMYSKKVNQIYERYTDRIEKFGIDESWLDVTGSERLFGNGQQIADKIREDVKNELGITVSVGVSFNKIFAKLGSDYKKPDATTVIDHENFKSIVFPLPISDLLYVGRNTTKALAGVGIKTIGDIANSNKEALKLLLGKSGEMLYDFANGNSSDYVTYANKKQLPKSIGNGMTFRRDISDIEDLKKGILALCDCIASRMQNKSLKVSGISVSIKDTHFKTVSKQKSLDFPTSSAQKIYQEALSIVPFLWDFEKPLRSLTVTGYDISEELAQSQITLFEEEDILLKKQENLDYAINKVRHNFGKSSVLYASILNNDLGIII
ncbi:MAG: DNA polymerase IV [Clostridia bacterium]|nr:DNA polymerase IV [Clostridia bacterium]